MLDGECVSVSVFWLAANLAERMSIIGPAAYLAFRLFCLCLFCWYSFEVQVLSLLFCCSAESQNESLSCSGTVPDVTWQPRQQAPPTDDSDMLFPSPPPELSCHVAGASAIPWPTDSLDSVPCVANIETNCLTDWNSMKLSVATVQSSEIASVVAETNIDSAALMNDAANMSSMLALIRNGVKLRKTVTNDRSAPRLS